jgi:hypothetical protein
MLNLIRTIGIEDENASTIIEHLSQMNALEYLDDSPTDFELSAQQLALLDQRTKSTVDDCISSSSSIKQIKMRHGL